MDDSIIVVGDYSSSNSKKQLGLQQEISCRNRISNPTAPTAGMSNKRKEMAYASSMGSKGKLDNSVIIIDDDDDDLLLTRRQFDSTLIILDSDDEIESDVPMVTDGAAYAKNVMSVDNHKKNLPVATNSLVTCPLKFVNSCSHVPVPAITQEKIFQKSATSTSVDFRGAQTTTGVQKQTFVNSAGVNAGASSHPVSQSRNASTVFGDNKRQQHPEKSLSPNKRTVTSPPKSSNTNESGRDQVWIAQRKVLFNAEAQKGGLLTATLDFSKNSTKKSRCNIAIEKRSKTNKGQQQDLEDSFRHLLGISKTSKRWQKKNKNKSKFGKRTSRQAAEADLNKVVLGIRNLSSECNVGTDVIQFTSGKSPASNLVSTNKVSTSVVKARGMSPKCPIVITDEQAVSDGIIDIDRSSQKTAASASENVAPSVAHKVDSTESDVVIIESTLNRKVAMVNSSYSNKGLSVTCTVSNRLTNATGSPLKMSANLSAGKPPPSPQTLVQNGHFNNPLTFVQQRLLMHQQLTIPFLMQQRPMLPTLPLQMPVQLPLQMPGTRPPCLKLRPIAIDGSNVAFSHGKNHYFSCRGIKLCIEFFRKRGHNVKAFVPQFRRCKSSVIRDQHILEEMSRGEDQTIVFTPSRVVNNCMIAAYDDRFIVEYAVQSGAVMVSNDNYRDIMKESPAFKVAIEKRLLMYTFVDDLFMVPNDPMGRNGPCLDAFLSFLS